MISEWPALLCAVTDRICAAFTAVCSEPFVLLVPVPPGELPAPWDVELQHHL